jgi:4a-hydroxytetrahydrobiopterin dehydratase
MWQEIDNKLCKTFIFSDFKLAFAFMWEVALLAEKEQHHPEWTNIYNKVEIKLCTHDSGNIVTEKDKSLAEKIDTIYNA